MGRQLFQHHTAPCKGGIALTLVLLLVQLPAFTDTLVYAISSSSGCSSAAIPFTSTLVDCWLQPPVKLNASDS
jgi:hypothetical protein